MYHAKRVRYVEKAEDMNKILDLVYNFTSLKEKVSKYYGSKITLSEKYLKVETSVVGEDYKLAIDYLTTWVFDLTGEFKNHVDPGTVYREMQKCYKPLDILKSEDNPFEMVKGEDGSLKAFESAKPLLWYNPKYDKTEHIVYGYDINSSYPYELSKQIPDTYRMRCDDVVGPGEIGFMMDANLTLVKEGKRADYVFPLIDSPYKPYIDRWYEIKKTTQDKDEKDDAKFRMNCLVGLLQRHNPFLRAYDINNANSRIQYYIEKYKDKICFCNTDSVYAIERIPEIEENIGTELGQWKFEVDGEMMRQVGCNYQIIGEHKKNSLRGVIKQKITDDYNILTDDTPTGKLKYEFDGKYIKENY